ncbi:DEAD/DEAH box helicase [Acrocarpospora macrocephala]|uniref:DEAD/DEAH box helicase n=1 Tax=Acrocarpospora macrocephala TaxID=150177 RepID=UPI001FE9FD37|nr:DEAD/DEAH box helicase [Acrocarpospora macrocephala]
MVTRVLHAIWAESRLALWAEDSTLPLTTHSRADVRDHPFALPASAVPKLAPPKVTAYKAAEPAVPVRSAVLLLPSSGRGPAPSPELGVDVTVRNPRVARWRVPIMPYAPGELDAIPGPSVRYFGIVGDFARDLVRRGRILPWLTEDEARWRPVLTGVDAARFRELAVAMPPVCRAVQEEGRSSEVLLGALTELVDQVARRAFPDKLIGAYRPGRKSALADRWLLALTDPEPRLDEVDEAEAAGLRTALAAWFEAARGLGGPVRVDFRLVEPGADDKWRVEFGLRSAEDPDVRIAAEDVWAGAEFAATPEPQKTLAGGLRRAVRLYPDLDWALRVPHPARLSMDTRGAFAFLRHAAPLLEAAGYGVRLPSWAGRTRLGLKMTTRSRPGPPNLGLREVVDFRMDLAVGDQVIDEAELAELARLKVPLVRVRGEWVELDDRQLKAALRAVEERRVTELTVGDVIREVVLGGADELPLVEVDADGLLGDLLSGETERRLRPVPTPATLDGALRPYQERGLAWLGFLSGLGLGGILADDMGLGKTITTLALLLAEREDAQPAATLLVCPMSLINNWQKEAARFAPSLRLYIHHGGARRRDEELAATIGAADLVITTYGTALRDLPALARQGWERVVCDEAQAIKNSAARQAQAVRQIRARTKLALTGTPVENHLAELWSIMEFCNPGLLGPARAFRTRYQEPIELRRDENAMRALRRATGPFVLRRLKTDKTIISDLPDKQEMKVWCTLTPEQARLYQAVVAEMMGRIENSDGIERRGNVLATMTRLKQVCNHPAHLLKDGSRLDGRSGKLARLEELAEEIIEEGDKALVFTQYAEFGTMLQPYLEARLDRPVLWLHGGLSKRRRDELVERFQGDDEPMIFLLSLKAAGVGLNLTAANHVIHVDRWWNPAVENQATDRAFRIGQTRNVQVRKFICVGTLEERVDEMIERKLALADSVVGGGEDWLADLSADQLRELFRLSPEAVR